MGGANALRCPVCKAGFRNERECPRCGSDLSALMDIAVEAYQFRCMARKALCTQRYDAALRSAKKAQSLHDTEQGRRMVFVARALSMVRVDRKSREHRAGIDTVGSDAPTI